MRRTFWISYLTNVALTLASLAILPDRVAIHFGARGLPDNWASKELNALLLLGLQTVLFALLYATPRLIFIVPPAWVNLPNKQHWLRAENRPATLMRLSAYLRQMGTALFVFLFVVGILTLQANLSEPVRLHLPLFLGALGAFLAYTGWWCVVFYRAFRLPPPPGTAAT